MTQGRFRPFGIWTAAVVLITLLLGALLLGADFWLARPDGWINSEVRIGRDFVNVWLGGKLALAGDVATVYDRAAYREALQQALRITGIYAYSYPPHSLLLAAPFGLMSYTVALIVWTVASLALFAHAARPWLADIGLPAWVALLFPASLVCVWAGHYGLLIGAMTLYGWRALDAAPHRAGVWFAAMSIKPHLGVLVPVVLAMRREWRAIAVAALYLGLLVLLSLLVFGWEAWRVYVTQTLSFQAGLIEARPRAFHLMMPTTTVSMVMVGLPGPPANIAQAVTAVLAIAVIVWAARGGARVRDLGLIAATAIFLILPYAFHYDMTVHCLATLVFAARASGEEARWQRPLLALAFLLPLFQTVLAATGVPAAPLILLAAIWVEATIARKAAAS